MVAFINRTVETWQEQIRVQEAGEPDTRVGNQTQGHNSTIGTNHQTTDTDCLK